MSQPPEYPGNPSDPQGGHSGYPPPPGRHSAPPPPPPGYGAPPPPPPNYGAPPPDYGQPQGPPPGQSGGYQAPGYTAPPPPPPYGGPGAPPPPPPGYPAGFGGGPVSDFSVGNAFSWAWAKFTQNIAALAVPTLIYFVALGAVIGIPFGIAMATSETTTTTYDYGSGYAYEASTSSFSAISYIVLTIGYIAAFFVAMYMQAALVTGALEIADGRPVSIGTFFKPRNVGGVLLATLLLGLAAVLTSCTFVGPLIITFFAQFAIAFVVDKGLSPVDSIKASFATVRANLGPSALSWLVQYAVVLVGEIACFVGLIAALPVASLIQVYTYRKLTGGQVVEDSQQQPGYPAGPPPGQYPGQQYA